MFIISIYTPEFRTRENIRILFDTTQSALEYCLEKGLRVSHICYKDDRIERVGRGGDPAIIIEYPMYREDPQH